MKEDPVMNEINEIPGKLKVLSLEDSDLDFEIISLQLINAGYDLNISHVDNRNDFLSEIQNDTFDVILADFNLPQFDAFEALKLCNEFCPDIPFICVSGSIGEIIAIELLKMGAVDYVLKDRMERLPFAIKRAIKEAQEKKALKIAEHALHKSESIQRKLIANIGDVIIIIDKNGINKYISPNIENLFGWKPEEQVGKHTEDVLHPDDLKKAKKFEAKIIKKHGTKGTLEVRFKRKDGDYVWVEITMVNLLSDPEIQGVLGNYHDISERKKAEESLVNLKTAIDKSKVSVVITNSEGKIEYVNPFFTETTGYSLTECLGQTPGVLNSGYHSAEYYKVLWETIKSGETWEGEFYNRKKNGEFYWENAIISPVENDKKVITHFVAVKTDITDAKKINQELLQAKVRAEESDRLKSAFLANMSHEIRTPMNGILGFAELLKEPDLSGEQQKYFISIIEKSGARMLNIINDIVDISKIESGQMRLENKETNINEQLDYIFNFFKPEVEAKGIGFSLKNALPVNEVNMFTDSEKIYAILTNLVKNAIKYTNEGTIEFGYVLKNELKTTQNDSGYVLEFFVKDSGIGIPGDRHNAIFERFIQADIIDKMARQGAGLGLAISKAYIEMLGGKIWVESELGQGSTFYFTLPFRPTANTEKKLESVTLHQPDDLQIRKRKFLIVEDDQSSYELLSIEIGKYCSEILIAKSGTEAIEIFRNNPDIDLIFMDIQLPEMSGYEVTWQIRQFNKEVLIIALTAFALSGDRNKALDAGCTDYLSKPVLKSELIELIKKYFDKQSEKK